MKRVALVLSMLCAFAKADVIVLNSSQEFRELVAESTVPVMVQFSAAWCGPCQQLLGVLKKVAKSYNDSQVMIAYVDADIHADLQKYLMGGYPTVRTFSTGKVAGASFVGSKSESYLRSFIDGVVKGGRGVADQEFGEYCEVE